MLGPGTGTGADSRAEPGCRSRVHIQTSVKQQPCFPRTKRHFQNWRFGVRVLQRPAFGRGRQDHVTLLQGTPLSPFVRLTGITSPPKHHNQTSADSFGPKHKAMFVQTVDSLDTASGQTLIGIPLKCAAQRHFLCNRVWCRGHHHNLKEFP